MALAARALRIRWRGAPKAPAQGPGPQSAPRSIAARPPPSRTPAPVEPQCAGWRHVRGQNGLYKINLQLSLGRSNPSIAPSATAPPPALIFYVLMFLPITHSPHGFKTRSEEH